MIFLMLWMLSLDCLDLCISHDLISGTKPVLTSCAIKGSVRLAATAWLANVLLWLVRVADSIDQYSSVAYCFSPLVIIVHGSSRAWRDIFLRCRPP